MCFFNPFANSTISSLTNIILKKISSSSVEFFCNAFAKANIIGSVQILSLLVTVRLLRLLFCSNAFLIFFCHSV